MKHLTSFALSPSALSTKDITRNNDTVVGFVDIDQNINDNEEEEVKQLGIYVDVAPLYLLFLL